MPGLGLPGLNDAGDTPAVSPSGPAQTAPARTEELSARSELRYEIALGKDYSITLVRGAAEIFGTELAPNTPYTLSGTKGAVYTWHGCTLELRGDAESEYVGTATEATVEWLNVHGTLQDYREDAAVAQSEGPRVLVVGPDAAGKSSLVKCLSAWALKARWTPTVVNLDPRQPVLSVASSLTAVTCNTMLDVERDGWGPGPTTAQGGIPDKDPLVYHYPFASPEDNGAYYRAVTTRMALAVTSKMQRDGQVKHSGIIIDTPGALNQPKNSYEILHHLVSEFSVNVVLVMGSERLYNDVSRKYAKRVGSDDQVAVLRIPPSPGAVSDDAAYQTAIRGHQIRTYFFEQKDTLHPKAYSWDMAELHVYRALDPSKAAHEMSFLPGMADDDDRDDNDDDDDYDPIGGTNGRRAPKIFEKVQVSQAMVNGLVAIKFAGGNDDQAAIRDGRVLGYAYIADVNETTRKVRVLYPHPGKFTDRAWVWCADWPEAVPDLAM